LKISNCEKIHPYDVSAVEKVSIQICRFVTQCLLDFYVTVPVDNKTVVSFVFFIAVHQQNAICLVLEIYPFSFRGLDSLLLLCVKKMVAELIIRIFLWEETRTDDVVLTN
jgi:hypothetical protein